MIAEQVRVGARVVFNDQGKAKWGSPVFDGVGTIVAVGFRGVPGTALVRWSMPKMYHRAEKVVEWWCRYDQLDPAEAREA